MIQISNQKIKRVLNHNEINHGVIRHNQNTVQLEKE